MSRIAGKVRKGGRKRGHGVQRHGLDGGALWLLLGGMVIVFVAALSEVVGSGLNEFA